MNTTQIRQEYKQRVNQLVKNYFSKDNNVKVEKTYFLNDGAHGTDIIIQNAILGSAFFYFCDKYGLRVSIIVAPRSVNSEKAAFATMQVTLRLKEGVE